MYTPITIALVSHIYFKRFEPKPFPFLALITSGAFLSFIYQKEFLHATFYRALVITTLWIGLYLFSLSASILIYRVSPWHPLASIPGPRLAATTKWWMVHRILWKGGRHTYFQELHAKYGPWVRVGPNEVSVNHADAVKAVYRLDRGPFYQGTPAKADSLITVADRQRHAQRRQAWAKAVTGETMYSYIPATQKRVTQLVEIIQRESSTNGKLNLDHWLDLFFMDLMGDMGFSGGFETMKAGKDIEGWLSILHMGVIFVSAMGQVPWLKSLLLLLPQTGPIQTFHTFTEEKVRQIQTTPSKEMRKDILSTVLDQGSGAPPLSRDEAAADASLVVVAATDTSVQTVISFIRYICVDKDRQARLQKELDDVFYDATGDLDTAALMQLPYLDACLQETLRIMPPGPFGPPRTTGESGARILEKYVPPNTTLHVPTYTLHRDPENFGPFADQFIPERWLEDDKNDKLQPCNREAFVPFSTGYSSCVGKPLAQQNIKILLAYLFHSFNISPLPDFDQVQFDASYKEYGLWSHEPLEVKFIPRTNCL